MVFCVDVRVLCQEQNGCAVRVDPEDLICQLYHSTIPPSIISTIRTKGSNQGNTLLVGASVWKLKGDTMHYWRKSYWKMGDILSYHFKRQSINIYV